MVRGKRNKGTRRWAFVGFLLLLCGGIIGAAGALVASENRYTDPSTVAGIDISGLTYEEALQHVEDVLEWEKRYVVLHTSEGEFTFSYVELGFEQEVEKTLRSHKPSGWWRSDSVILSLRVDLNEEKLRQSYEQLLASLYREPESAEMSIEAGEVVITNHIIGVTLDYDDFKDAVWSGEMWHEFPTQADVPLRALAPETSREDLLALGLERCIARFTTEFSTANVSRAKNIELATGYIDGHMLAPGEVFSFNEVVGPRTAERGYGLADVFFRHEVRQGIGGGVCQVSTTLYNTTLMANLEIVQRSSHGQTVSYVKIGLDAAVHYSAGQDLRFRNDTGTHLLITGEVDNGRLTFCFYGTAPEDLRVETFSKVVETFPYETEIIEDPELPEGQKEITGGVRGRRVVAEAKVFMNGKEHIRPLSPSYYIPIPKEIRIGTMPVEQPDAEDEEEGGNGEAEEEETIEGVLPWGAQD